MSSQSQKSQALLSLWGHLVLTSIAKQTHTLSHTHTHTHTHTHSHTHSHTHTHTHTHSHTHTHTHTLTHTHTHTHTLSHTHSHTLTHTLSHTRWFRRVLCSLCVGGWWLASGAALGRPAGVCSGERRAKEHLILSSGATGHGWRGHSSQPAGESASGAG